MQKLVMKLSRCGRTHFGLLNLDGARERLFTRRVLAAGIHHVANDKHHDREGDAAVAEQLFLVLFKKCYGVADFKREPVRLKFFAGNSRHENLR